MQTDFSIRHDKQVSWVRIPMKTASNEELVNECIDHDVSKAWTIIDQDRVINSMAVAELLHQYPIGGLLLEHPGNINGLGILKNLAKADDVGTLMSELKLLAQVTSQLIDQFQWTELF